MDREYLGQMLLQWHSSMGDPVYAVGSFYISGKVYPDKDIVLQALCNLDRYLGEFRAMNRGRPVMVERFGKMVNLKAFAGYKRKAIRENIRDLKIMTLGLGEMLIEDYSEEV